MTYVPYERVSGFNTIKWMIDIALGIKHIKEDLPEELNTAYRGCACSYFLFSTKEGCFAPFQGIDIVEKLPMSWLIALRGMVELLVVMHQWELFVLRQRMLMSCAILFL